MTKQTPSLFQGVAAARATQNFDADQPAPKAKPPRAAAGRIKKAPLPEGETKVDSESTDPA